MGADNRLVRDMFARMELHSGAPGIDLRLTGEIYGRLHMKIRELGLDPNDTTPHELYHALLSLTSLHDEFLVKRLDIDDPNDTGQISNAVVKIINHIKYPKHSWALKSTAAKRLLKATPPKLLMKQLNYRSVDSLLRREPASILVTIARHTEPTQWQEKFVNSYKKLRPNDFEVRDIEVVHLSDKRWEKVGKALGGAKHNSIVHSPEAGVVILLPVQINKPRGLTLVSILLTLHYINEIRAFSTYCKFHHMRPDFSKLLIEHVLNQKQDHVSIAGHPVHWRVIHRYYGSTDKLNHPELFEPHVQPEDLAYRKAEDVLFRLEPALHFWHDTDFLGLPQPDGPISFSLTDMAMNLVNKLNFEGRVNYHMQESLWNEVYFRYFGQRSLENQILYQLDEQSTLERQTAMDMDFVV